LSISDYPQIIRLDSFERNCIKIAEDFDRLAVIDMIIDWDLCRNPKRGVNVAKNLYLWKIVTLYPEIYPNLLILYEYFEPENKVELIDIEAV
jgi:hypothetical protein